MGKITAHPLDSDLLAALAAEQALRQPETVVLLPNFRSCERLKTLLFELGAGMLPRIMPLGQLDEIWLAQLAMQADDAQREALLSIPRALDNAECQLSLAQYLRGLHRDARLPELSIAQALAMSRSIWQVFDRLEREGKPVSSLVTRLRGNVSQHWQERLEWLSVAAEWWQRYSAEKEGIARTQRRTLLAQWLAAYWRSEPPDHSVFLAGSTGTQASTLNVMQAVLALPCGELWLQGMTENAGGQDTLPLSHPAAIFRQLYSVLGVTPDVSAPNRYSPRVAELLDGFSAASPAALPVGVHRMDAADEIEEAQLAAVLIREALLTSDDTVALISPDPLRLRRVVHFLHEQGVQMDSAVGQSPLSVAWIAGWHALLAALLQSHNTVSWLALMKHPLQQLMPLPMLERFERDMLRGRQSMLSMPERIQRWLLTADGVPPGVIAQCEAWLGEVEALLNHQQSLRSGADWFASHQAMTAMLFGAAEEAALTLLERIEPSLSTLEAVSFDAYAAAADITLETLDYFPRVNAHPRLKCTSPIEARHMHFGRVILMGLNEGIWPTNGGADSWLHPHLASQLGLMPDAMQVALSAHDFLMLSASARQVVWLRSVRDNGSEQLPSRWLERFEPSLSQMPLGWLRSERCQFLLQPALRPVAMPPAEAFPGACSVSAIEQLLRDPYGFYAKYILRLRALDPLDRTPDAQQRGDIVHRVMEAFVIAVNDGAPLERATFETCTARMFRDEGDPLIRQQWLPRLYALADAAVQLETERRGQAVEILPEQEISAPIGKVTLFGRADRIERSGQSAAIIDYKSGGIPKKEDVNGGVSPQLPLLAWMQIQAGATHISELAYWKLGGAQEKIDQMQWHDPSDLIAFYANGLSLLLGYYASQDARYPALPQAAFAPTFNDYAHLERAAEWQYKNGD